MRGRSVRMRIGMPIPPKDMGMFGSVEQLGRYLRAKTYALGSGVQVKREQFRPQLFPRRPKPIPGRESPLHDLVVQGFPLRMTARVDGDVAGGLEECQLLDLVAR